MGLSPVPSLQLVQEKADELALQNYDVHTMTMITNGNHGGWDVTFLATDSDLEPLTFEFTMDPHGCNMTEGE